MSSHALPPPKRTRRLSIGSVIVAALVLLSVAVGVVLIQNPSAPDQVLNLGPGNGSEEVDPRIYVHVLGEVAHPGLYLLQPDGRVVDAIAAAGGSTAAANLASVNLARLIVDGEQVLIPATGTGAEVIETADPRINLNTADSAELESLPGIGPAIAGRILAWRKTNGSFTTIDNLLEVPGIGPKLLSSLTDLIRVT